MHFFINKYPYNDNPDIRKQLSNFANIPICPEDLEDILPEKIDAFVLNPLNRHDFPPETIEYLKSFIRRKKKKNKLTVCGDEC